MQKLTTLQDFTILQKLGEGSFGQVFKVKRTSDGQEYALKKVKINFLKQKERENALNEIRILASISDNHIVAYKEAFYDDSSSCLCVIMELASGGDIQKQIQQCIRKNQTIPEPEIWKALAQMSLGLRLLHKVGILHRDLKCANVFKSAEGTYKIGDMNVSKVSHGALAKTQTGTPYYASPEVWKDQPYSSPADVWSLGCVIYEMATLKPPFRAQDMKGLYRKVQSGIYDKLPKQYSKELSNVINSLLKVPPQLRPSCDQILSDPAVIANCGDIIPKQRPLSKAELLQTILLPKNLKQLQGNLPKPMYDNDGEFKEQNFRQPPKSTRSISVNEPKKPQIAISQTPQIQKKQVNNQRQVNSKPNIPLGPKPQQQNQQPLKLQRNMSNQHRPKSAIREQSPSYQRKSVDNNQSEHVKRQAAINRAPSPCGHNLGPRKNSAQQLK